MVCQQKKDPLYPFFLHVLGWTSQFYAWHTRFTMTCKETLTPTVPWTWPNRHVPRSQWSHLSQHQAHLHQAPCGLSSPLAISLASFLQDKRPQISKWNIFSGKKDKKSLKDILLWNNVSHKECRNRLPHSFVFTKKTSHTKNINLTSYTHFFYLLDQHSTCNLFLWMVRVELFFSQRNT